MNKEELATQAIADFMEHLTAWRKRWGKHFTMDELAAILTCIEENADDKVTP